MIDGVKGMGLGYRINKREKKKTKMTSTTKKSKDETVP